MKIAIFGHPYDHPRLDALDRAKQLGYPTKQPQAPVDLLDLRHWGQAQVKKIANMYVCYVCIYIYYRYDTMMYIYNIYIYHILAI